MDNNGPLCLSVPIGEKREPDLIAALDFLMAYFLHLEETDDSMGRVRAADWLHAKFGSRR